jgi:hypothetical protein
MTIVKHKRKLSDQSAWAAWEAGEAFIVLKSDELPKGAVITKGDAKPVVYRPKNDQIGIYLEF